MPNYDEQVELAKRVTAGDEEAKKQMVAANLRLVLHWARRYQDRGVEMVDLVQEGTFDSCAPSRSSTGSAASNSPRTPPGGSVKLCNAPSSSTVARSASPSKSASSSSDSKRPPLNSRRSLVASRPTTS